MRRPATQVEDMFASWSRNDSPSAVGYAITNEADRLIGHVAVHGLTLPSRIGTLAILIGPEFQGSGYGKEAIEVILRLAFGEMGAHKIELQAWEFNTRALRLYASLGFVEEGRRRAAVFHAGKFYSQVQLGLLADEHALPDSREHRATLEQ